MREAEKGKNKILVANSVHTQPTQENSKKNSKKNSKNYKTSSRHYFYQKRDEIGRKREKKNFSP